MFWIWKNGIEKLKRMKPIIIYHKIYCLLIDIWRQYIANNITFYFKPTKI